MQTRHLNFRRFLVVIAIAILICGSLIPAIWAARDLAAEMTCRNNIKQIALGLLNYESASQSLLIAIETTADGQLWRSWRTRVYPTMMESMQPIYDEFAAWDSEVNTRLLNGTPITRTTKDGRVDGTLVLPRVPLCFTCPRIRSVDHRGVNYVVVCGDKTAFPKSGPIRLTDITDGLENTILVVESITCSPDWTEPRDLNFDTMDFKINSRTGPSISSLHSSGAFVCFADGEVYCVTPKVTETEVKALLTIAGDENIKRGELVTRGVLIKR